MRGAMDQQLADTPRVRHLDDRVVRRHHQPADGNEAMLERHTATILRRIGFAGVCDDEDCVRALMPFVIHPEFRHTIPPLASIPLDYDDMLMGPHGPVPAHSADTQYRNVPLSPLPVSSPALAPWLVRLGHDEVAFVDGHNVYGANLFERHEGRRLLRRAVGYLFDELADDGGDFDIISYEGDGFLISRRRRPGREPLEARLQRIIARMTGQDGNDEVRGTTRSRLATFYRYARKDVLAPASVCYEPRDDLARRLLPIDIYLDRPMEERFARLQETHDGLASLVTAIRRMAPHQQTLALNLIEHATYDPVLQTLADELGSDACAVRAFNDPGRLLDRVSRRSVLFFRLELVSLLKAVNEHPFGGFQAGDEALRTVYRVLVTTIQRVLREAGSDAGDEICTFRRWGEFYFGVNRDIACRRDVAAIVERAFEGNRYMVMECRHEGRSPHTVFLAHTCPQPAGSRIVVPVMPTVTLETRLSGDMLSMPIDEPERKVVAISKRLSGDPVPDLDVVFLADWTFNACDARRGIPRLVRLLNATDGDIQALARCYESYVGRKGRRQYRIRRETRAIRAFASRLKSMIAGSVGRPSGET